MFGFGSSSKTDEPPSRTERDKCHKHRDAYYDCLRLNQGQYKVFVPGKEEKSVCRKERDAYKGSCAASWGTLSRCFARIGITDALFAVEYFDLKVVSEQNNAATRGRLEGR